MRDGRAGGQGSGGCPGAVAGEGQGPAQPWSAVRFRPGQGAPRGGRACSGCFPCCPRQRWEMGALPWRLSASFPLGPPGDCRDTLVCGCSILGVAAVSLSFAASPGPRGVVVLAHTAGLKGVLTVQVWSVCTGFSAFTALGAKAGVAAEGGDLRVEFCAWRFSL